MAAPPRPVGAVPPAAPRPATGVVASPSPAPTPMGVSKTLLVSPAIPDKSMVYHNHVYVAPTDASGLFPLGFEANNFVQLNGGPIFILQTHPDQHAGEIGMSAMTRKSLDDIQPGSSCRVSVWSLTAESTALSIRVQVNVFKEKKRCEIKEDDVVDIIREKLAGHVLTRNQVLAADFKGTAITLTVQAIEVPERKASDTKDDGVTRFGSCGVITGATRIQCSPYPDNRYLIWEKSANNSASMLLKPDFKFADMGIGGLDEEFAAIFRRSFASRLFPPAVITQLGIKHVKGMLLFGPPGTGKTLIARQIGKMLAGKEPKIVNGPEILNKYVGASEENIRNLFADAEAEYKAKGDASGLHIIIFDEIDAICKQRGSDKSGTGVHDTVVNQLLSKIDGVDALNNILVIGMTNRKDMIDQALLRPGRLEVHVEIGLPDEAGRLQILKIHTRRMAESQLLGPDVNLELLASKTKNFSGAEIEGLVKSATSYALYGNVDVTKGAPTAKPDIKNIKIVMDHFLTALDEVVPAFGVAEDELKTCMRGEMLDWGAEYRRIVHTGKMLVRQVGQSASTPLLSALIEGPSGSGKTALAAKLALESGFPYVKLITPENFVDSSERGKVLDINKVFEDAYKSPLSLIIIDNIERLLEYVPIGPRFSNTVLQCLMVLLKKIPPHDGRRLIVLATTSNMRILEDMDMRNAFNVVMHMPQLKTPDDVKSVFTLMNLGVDAKELDLLASESPLPIGIKELLMVIEMARQDVATITAARFSQCMEECGFKGRSSKNFLDGNGDDLT